MKPMMRLLIAPETNVVYTAAAARADGARVFGVGVVPAWVPASGAFGDNRGPSGG